MQHDNSPSPTPSPLPSPTASLKPSPEANFLFVYGTLRLDVRSALQERGIANHALEAFHSNLHSKAQFVASAQVLGRLYLVTDNSADAPAHYPALVLAAKHSYPIMGELYALPPEFDFTLLDEYEECSARCPKPHLYRREKINVQLTNSDFTEQSNERRQQSTWAWCYVYNQSTDLLAEIRSGDFAKALFNK